MWTTSFAYHLSTGGRGEKRRTWPIGKVSICSGMNFKDGRRRFFKGSRLPHLLDLPTSEKHLVFSQKCCIAKIILRHQIGQETIVILQDISRMEHGKGRREAIPTSFGLFERLSLNHRESFYLNRDKRTYDRPVLYIKKVVVRSGHHNEQRHVAEQCWGIDF